MFAEEKARIGSAIGHYVEEMEHIGSTAVPRLAAKPVIDVMVGVRTLNDGPACVEGLVGIGYEYVPEIEEWMPERRYFRKFDAKGVRTHQVHLVERSNSEWWDRHIAFRDYLRAHPETAREYGRVKQEAAAIHRDDRGAYMDAKDAFVREVQRRALDWRSAG
jgi:GrpB-like predicted nucleotidyltransferase (UPF0157 family)